MKKSCYSHQIFFEVVASRKPTRRLSKFGLTFSQMEVSSHTCEKHSHCENSHSHSFSSLSHVRKKSLLKFSRLPVSTFLNVLMQVLTSVRRLLTDFGENSREYSLQTEIKTWSGCRSQTRTPRSRLDLNLNHGIRCKSNSDLDPPYMYLIST